MIAALPLTVLPSGSESTGSCSWPLISFSSGRRPFVNRPNGLPFAEDDLLEVVAGVAQGALGAPAGVRRRAAVIDVADVQGRLLGHLEPPGLEGTLPAR